MKKLIKDAKFLLLLTGVFIIIMGCSNKVNCDSNEYDISRVSLSSANLDTTEAMTYLSDFIKQNPTCVNGLLSRGFFYFFKDEIDSSIKDYKAVLRLDPDNTAANYYTGLAFQFKNDHDSAIYYFSRAKETKRHGEVFIDYSKSGGESSELKKYDIDINLIQFRLGISNYDKRNSKEAFKNFSFCIANNYMIKDALLYRGVIYLESKDTINACNDFNNALMEGNQEAQQMIQKYCNK